MSPSLAALCTCGRPLAYAEERVMDLGRAVGFGVCLVCEEGWTPDEYRRWADDNDVDYVEGRGGSGAAQSPEGANPGATTPRLRPAFAGPSIRAPHPHATNTHADRESGLHRFGEDVR